MSKKLLTLFLASFLCILTIGSLGSIVHAYALSGWHYATPPSAIVAQQHDIVADANPEVTTTGDQDGFVPLGVVESDNPTGNRQVIGRDDRVPMTSRAYPWSTIGRLEHLDDKGRVTIICTGSLIGNDLVLTNSHCVVDEDTHKLTGDVLRFRPNLIDNRSRTSAFARRVRYGDNGERGFFGENDWALIRLDQPLGRQQGTLGWRNLSTESLRRLVGKVQLAGYSADFPPDHPGKTAGVDRECSILGDGDMGFLRHDCDTFGGASGSPLLVPINGKFQIVALHAGTYDNVNRAIKVSRWSQSALAMR